MRQKLVVGNWKMHGSLAANEALLRALVVGLGSTPQGVALAVCPPFPYLSQAASVLAATPIALGAQDVSRHTQGAYTGEVSGPMLRDLGCRFVIVGHSERRTLHAETDEGVAAKAVAAREAGLTPIICVGETRAERESGITEDIIARQVDAVVEHLGAAGLAGSVLAYEPVWAIGTGLTATPDEAQAVHAFIRSRIARRDESVAAGLQILYGGSVKSQNASTLFAMPDIDGGLIGGASLVAEDFVAIARAAR
ncbi:MAG: triosephosphate isomerase [Pseudomonadota bacterium]|jgi:triosephosphate isomerase